MSSQRDFVLKCFIMASIAGPDETLMCGVSSGSLLFVNISFLGTL